MDKRGESDDFGAARITAHPILGELPPVPLVEFTFDGEAVAGRDGRAHRGRAHSPPAIASCALCPGLVTPGAAIA